MYSLEILLASTTASAAVAALITYWFHSSSATKKQALKTEAELREIQEAFEAYRKEVLEEFSETASKFKTLNTSYIDLHQQLARSANILCGEAAANTLLEAPVVQTTSPAEPETTSTIENVEVEFEAETMAKEEASTDEPSSEFTGHEDNPDQAFVKH